MSKLAGARKTGTSNAEFDLVRTIRGYWDLNLAKRHTARLITSELVLGKVEQQDPSTSGAGDTVGKLIADCDFLSLVARVLVTSASPTQHPESKTCA